MRVPTFKAKVADLYAPLSKEEIKEASEFSMVNPLATTGDKLRKVPDFPLTEVRATLEGDNKDIFEITDVRTELVNEKAGLFKKHRCLYFVADYNPKQKNVTSQLIVSGIKGRYIQ